MMTLTSGDLIVIRGDLIIDGYGDAALLHDRLRAAAVGVPERHELGHSRAEPSVLAERRPLGPRVRRAGGAFVHLTS
jgi:hypothetical protein